MLSIIYPEIIAPIGTIKVIMDAAKLVRSLDTFGMSLSLLSSCGTRTAENDNAIPTVMCKLAANIADLICS